MQDVRIYYLNTNDFDIAVVEDYLYSKFNISFDKSIRTYKEKLFSQYIRYFVFKEKFGISSPEFIYDDSGKPYLDNANYEFSISHTAGVVIIAVSLGRVGVDIESIRHRKNILGIAERFFAKNELESLKDSSCIYKDFFTLWTLKEAQVKMTSDGIAKGLMTATFDLDEQKQWQSCNSNNSFKTFYIGDYVFSVCIDTLFINCYILNIENNTIVKTLPNGTTY